MLYLYGVVESSESLDDTRGAAGESLQCIAVESLCAIAGELSVMPPLDRTTLVAQDRVVRALHQRVAALLPMRFGTAYPERAQAERAIHTRASALREALALVRHREQMTLRFLGAREATSAGAAAAAPLAPLVPLAPQLKSGRRYLEDRAARRLPPDIVPVLDALNEVQRATRIDASRTPGLIATVYHLIERGAADEYRARATTAAGRLEGISVRVSGPAPCYAFAGI